jgi:hypothetical protein
LRSIVAAAETPEGKRRCSSTNFAMVRLKWTCGADAQGQTFSQLYVQTHVIPWGTDGLAIATTKGIALYRAIAMVGLALRQRKARPGTALCPLESAISTVEMIPERWRTSSRRMPTPRRPAYQTACSPRVVRRRRRTLRRELALLLVSSPPFLSA